MSLKIKFKIIKINFSTNQCLFIILALLIAPITTQSFNTRWPMTLNFTIEPIDVLTIELF